MRRRFLPLLLAAAGLVAAAVPTLAITNGVPDGERHPNVGALVADLGGVRKRICTGTLIAPTVFLTAAHCTAYLESRGVSRPLVTFDSEYDPVHSTFHTGTMHTNPRFSPRQSDPGDIAVVTFEAPVAIQPARLPPARLLESLAAKRRLRNQTFTAVGYGSGGPVVDGGAPTFPPLDAYRRVSTSRFRALDRAWLRLSQNRATGDGGTCYGDSGGPNFLGDSDVIAAITVTGDAMCRATNVTYRVDTPAARAFLREYVALP